MGFKKTVLSRLLKAQAELHEAGIKIELLDRAIAWVISALRAAGGE